MKTLFVIIAIVLLAAAALFVWTRILVAEIENANPPAGQFAELDGGNMHFVDLAETEGDALPVFFIHGASGNLNDQCGAYEESLSGKRRMIFVDRPGHGYSDLAGATDPAKQAGRFAALLDELEIDKVVVVCHSMGCSSAAAFAVLHPDKVAGLVFVAPATHPWPGGVTWYYDVASIPVLGHLFTETLVVPVARSGLSSGIRTVFSPNEMPDDYAKDSALELFLRPHVFRNNARDVATLKRFVTNFSTRYTEIEAPTIVITGDSDDVVLPEIHSVGLERDIEGAELVVLPDVGHKPDYVATQTVLEAIEKVSRRVP